MHITREEIDSWRGDNDTLRDPNSHVTFHRPPSIQERIYGVVAGSTGAVTRGQIASALGLKKSPYLTQAIDGMVADGYLIRLHGVWKNGCLMYFYEVNR